MAHSIDRTPEYDDFIAKLRVFHDRRGTSFDPEPKLGLNHVDLYKLFTHIIEHGGYDQVSDEKLAWRKMCEGLGLMTSNPPAAAFSLKSIFYRYLAAYEIKTVHNQEPPPPEILEHVSAKGSGLLTRTLETFAGHRRDNGNDQSGDDATPARDRRAEDTPGSGRASRGLREAPAQRVIFQPDTDSPRQRHVSGQHSTSASQNAHSYSHSQSHPYSRSHLSLPHMQASHHQPQRGGPSFSWAPPNSELVSSVSNYQPGEQVLTATRIVSTPANNPEVFAQARRLASLQAAGRSLPDPSQNRAPGTGCEGPNIYLRCLMALRSGIPAEQAFGLYHLVKISYERGDKFRFEQFPGLVEGLTEKALEVGSLFYDVKWTISYDADPDDGPIGELDGVDGTLDILDRIAQLKPKSVMDNILPAEFTDDLVQITEAVLTIRNMAMLPDNAGYLAEFPTLKDLLCIILCLPKMELVVELKHFALDIAEQITPYLSLEADDPLYQTLLAQLDSIDRGTILTALRAVGRTSMNLAEMNKLGGVPPKILENIMNWLLLNDDELMDACLDFLYQYTAVTSNVETLLKSVIPENLVSHLVRLLSHGAKREHRDFVIEPERKEPGGEEVIQIPFDLLESLMQMDEPERCYQWLRCFFEEDPDSQITQIAIWQAYNTAFLEALKKADRTMINAAEFIRNISQVYQSAGAQIVRDQGPTGEVTKFIIRGIRPRTNPVSPDGREYVRCLWSRRNRQPREPPKCGGWFVSAEKMYNHIITFHVGETRSPDSPSFRNREDQFYCQWGDCRKYPTPTKLPLALFMAHVKTHVVTELRKHNTQNKSESATHTPSGTGNNGSGSSSNAKRGRRPYVTPAKTISITYEETQTMRDERNPNAPPQAAGSPLSAILVLRNLARNVQKTESEEELLRLADEGGEPGGWNERLFRPVMPRLYEILAENRALAPHITSLLQVFGEL